MVETLLRKNKTLRRGYETECFKRGTAGKAFKHPEYCRKKEYNACAEPFPFRRRQKKAHIVATDLETAIKEPLQVKVEQEGKLCIPARKMFEIVKEVDGDITMETEDGQWLKVNAGLSKFKLACLSADEFPAWPGMENVEEMQMDTKTL